MPIFASAAATSAAVAALWLWAGPTHAQPDADPEDDASAEDSAPDEEILARGEYLVRRVAMCHQCHTPRGPDGELRDDAFLMGAPMPIAPPHFVERWGLRAPAIAGLPGYHDDEAMRLLTRGVTRRNTHPRPPMPRYQMSDDDARAIIAYLRSL